jgi:hypothetical protein
MALNENDTVRLIPDESYRSRIKGRGQIIDREGQPIDTDTLTSLQLEVISSLAKAGISATLTPDYLTYVARVGEIIEFQPEMADKGPLTPVSMDAQLGESMGKAVTTTLLNQLLFWRR